MAASQNYLKAFGIFSAGSLITYATVNRDNIKTSKSLALKDSTLSQNSLVKENRPAIITITNDSSYNDVIQKCRSKLEQWKTKECIPGMVVGVTVKGRPVWKYASGYSDIENNVPCTEDTMMRIASISKSVTSTFLMKMVEKNLLDLDKPIRTYLTSEQFPDKTWEDKPVEITLRQLCAHLGGIRHYKKLEKDADQQTAEFLTNKTYKTAIESLAIFKDDPLSKFVCSNLSFFLY